MKTNQTEHEKIDELFENVTSKLRNQVRKKGKRGKVKKLREGK